MSQIVSTDVGRFNRVSDGRWLWECPKCHSWGSLSADQVAGCVSVDCSGPMNGNGCDYHETHNFGAALVAKLQTRALFNEPPFDPETKDLPHE